MGCIFLDYCVGCCFRSLAPLCDLARATIPVVKDVRLAAEILFHESKWYTSVKGLLRSTSFSWSCGKTIGVVLSPSKREGYEKAKPVFVDDVCGAIVPDENHPTHAEAKLCAVVCGMFPLASSFPLRCHFLLSEHGGRFPYVSTGENTLFAFAVPPHF